MDVCVGHLKTKHGLSYLYAVEHLLLGNGYLLGKKLKVTQFLVSQVKQIVNLTLGDAQNVSLYQGVDIQECKAVLCLCNLVSGYLTCNDTAKDCHDQSDISSISKPILPLGI